MGIGGRWFVIAAALAVGRLAQAGSPTAADGPRSDVGTLEALGPARIDWTQNIITVSVSAAGGAKGLPLRSVATRASSEDGAKRDWVRLLRSALERVRVTDTRTIHDLLQHTPALSALIDTELAPVRIRDTRYFADGGVQLSMEVRISAQFVDRAVAAARLPRAVWPSSSHEAPTDGVSGVVIHLSDALVPAALAPSIWSEAGALLYSAANVSASAMLQFGSVAYVRSLDAALRDARVGSQALLLHGHLKGGAGTADIALGVEDAAKFLAAHRALAQGRVIVVLP